MSTDLLDNPTSESERSIGSRSCQDLKLSYTFFGTPLLPKSNSACAGDGEKLLHGIVEGGRPAWLLPDEGHFAPAPVEADRLVKVLLRLALLPRHPLHRS